MQMQKPVSQLPDKRAEQRALSNYAAAYEQEACELLRQMHPQLEQITAEFSHKFVQGLIRDPSSPASLKQLSPKERIVLEQTHREHLSQLLSPEVNAKIHFRRATDVGRTHELVGVGLNALLEGYHQYQQEARVHLRQSDLGLHQKERLQSFIQQRLLLDLEAQIVCHYQVDNETATFIYQLDGAIRTSKNLPDLLRSTMSAVTQLQGIVASMFHRPDARGYLRVEAAEGLLGAAYAERMEQMKAPLVRMSGDQAEGQGPSGRAWRTGAIVTSNANSQQLDPWKAAWIELGFRSSAAIPLLDDGGRAFALLAFYSQIRGTFDSTNSQLILHHVQQTLSRAVTRYERDKVITLRNRRAYCRLLEAGAVEMHYQPIISLKTGKLSSVETLARLRTPRGSLVTPGAFLPAFGKVDLLRLFELALTQAGQAFSLWKNNGLMVPVSINLPSNGLIDDTYRDVVLEILRHGVLKPEHIRLELLETRDPVDLRRRDARIAEFQGMGLNIVQDDLGSGYSTLLRLGHIRFDSVKIDQGLVKGARNNPQQALEFILHLTRLTQGFGIPVTVEGIENRGLLEAAALLGSDRGQGHFIGKPMPATEIVPWHRNFRLELDPIRPKTPLGALAGYLLWDEQLKRSAWIPDRVGFFSGVPCCVQHYIDDAGDIRISGARSVQSLLGRIGDDALHGFESNRYQQAKRILVSALSRASKKEWSAL